MSDALLTELVGHMRTFAEGQERISQVVGKLYDGQERLAQDVVKLSHDVVRLSEGQLELQSGLSTLTVKVDGLEEGQRNLEAGLSSLGMKVEGPLTDKIRALFDARQVSLDSDRSTDAKLDRICAVLDQLAGSFMAPRHASSRPRRG